MLFRYAPYYVWDHGSLITSRSALQGGHFLVPGPSSGVFAHPNLHFLVPYFRAKREEQGTSPLQELGNETSMTFLKPVTRSHEGPEGHSLTSQTSDLTPVSGADLNVLSAP